MIARLEVEGGALTVRGDQYERHLAIHLGEPSKVW